MGEEGGDKSEEPTPHRMREAREKGQVAKLFSDFATDDCTALHEIEGIELDDVLDLHDFLAEFDGDFMNLFVPGKEDGEDDGEEDGVGGVEFY